MYTAVVLCQESVNLLRKLICDHIDVDFHGYLFQTQEGKSLPHHMTLNLGPIDLNINNADSLGKNVELWFDKLAMDHNLGVCAMPINRAIIVGLNEKVNSVNSQPHITCCLKKGTKPKTANQLFVPENFCVEMIEFGESIVVSGVVMVCE